MIFLGPPVVDLYRGVDFISLKINRAGVFFDANADCLLARLWRAGVANDVVSEHEIFCVAADANSGGVTLCAIVFNDVILETIAVAGHAQGLIAKEDAVLMVGAHVVFLEKIIGVLMANGNAKAAIVFEDVFLE